MSVSTRTRFEILKRDGFRCRYCGATSIQSPLHVDHVIPVAEGGSDDPANLTAACAGCNLGKSDVELDDIRIASDMGADSVREHAAQVRAYLGAQRDLQAAREEAAAWVIDEWHSIVGRQTNGPIQARLRSAMMTHSFEEMFTAMHALRRKDDEKALGAQASLAYFNGVLRNMRQER